jgi:hypothetical protein
MTKDKRIFDEDKLQTGIIEVELKHILDQMLSELKAIHALLEKKG